MKIKLISACFACGIFVAHADDITLNVIGKILATPCVVDPGTVNQTVEFGQAIATDFKQAGDAGKWKDFALSLSRCPVTTTESEVTFGGTPDNDAPDKFINNGTSKGLALELANRAHDTQFSPGSKMRVNVDSSAHTALFPLSARMVSTTGAATGGTFASVVQLTFTYH